MSSQAFLYPRSRQFPIDEVTEEIILELQKRNWKVPGMRVEFETQDRGRARYVSYVHGENFRLWFLRPQGYIPGGFLSDISAVSEIVIPGKELHVYHDESGPTLYLYVGDDYERDRDLFVNGTKIHSKLDGKKKMYLKYTGGCDCKSTSRAAFGAINLLGAVLTQDMVAIQSLSHTHPGRRSPLLVSDNDLGREYDPEGDEPVSFKTSEVMEEFRSWLTENVLNTILKVPY